MGLDMHLIGEKFFWTDWNNPENNITEDGFRLQSKRLELGYWRKHPNLHGYIVEHFADGVDDCQEIYLAEKDLTQIIEAVEADTLPETKGFFFGTSESADSQETIKQLHGAIEWLQIKEDQVIKEVIYRASW